MSVVVGVFFLPFVLSAASLQISGERASLEADNESLSEVLLLFEQQGVATSIDPSIKQHPVSGNWQNVKIDWLIGRVSGQHSYILKWKRDINSNDRFVLSGIDLFPQGKAPVSSPESTEERLLDVVEGENGTQYLRGEVIVGFNKNASIENLDELLDKLNGSVIEIIEPIGLYRIKIDDKMSVEEALQIIKEHENVTTAEPNLALPKVDSSVSPLPPVSSSIERNLPVSTTLSTIAVLDSGLDPAYSESTFITGTYNALDPSTEITDPTGHGTLTSLIAAGAITPIGGNPPETTVPVLSIRAFDENGMTSSDTILRALEYANESGATIVSMSWGTETSSQFLETAMNYAKQSGITLYAAAGNSPSGTPVYPAGYDSVIAIGGLNPDGSRWDKSNYGDFVEYYEPALANFNDQSYAGTSISTPYAAFKAAQKAKESTDP